MNRLTKTFVIFSFLLIFFCIIGWTILKSIKPELIKDYVSAQLTAFTQQPSKVTGEVSWQMFPHPGVKLTSVEIGEENKTRYTAKLENLRFDLKIMPLLSGKLVFTELNVNGFSVDVNLNNEYSHPPILQEKILTKKSNNISEKFAIERILLSRGQLAVTQGQEKIIFSNLQIGAEQFNLKKAFFPVQLRTNLEVRSEEIKQVAAFANFKGRVALSNFSYPDILMLLKNTALKGQLVVENLDCAPFKINKITTNIKTKLGILLFNPLTINLYNGESVGDLSYDFATRKFLFNQTATNLDGNKLVYDLIKNNSFKGGVDLSVHTQGDLRQKDWKDKMTVKGNLTIKEGAMQLINLDEVVLEMANKMSAMLNKTSQTNPQLSQLTGLSSYKGDIRFRLLTLQYSLQNAKLRSDSYVLQTNNIQLKGEGEFNFAQKKLDSRLLATINLDNPKLIKVQETLGGSFPLLIKGTLEEPTILPNLKVIGPMLTRMWLRETLLSPIVPPANDRPKIDLAKNELLH